MADERLHSKLCELPADSKEAEDWLFWSICRLLQLTLLQTVEWSFLNSGWREILKEKVYRAVDSVFLEIGDLYRICNRVSK